MEKFKIKMFESREFEHEIVVEAKDEVGKRLLGCNNIERME